MRPSIIFQHSHHSLWSFMHPALVNFSAPVCGSIGAGCLFWLFASFPMEPCWNFKKKEAWSEKQRGKRLKRVGKREKRLEKAIFGGFERKSMGVTLIKDTAKVRSSVKALWSSVEIVLPVVTEDPTDGSTGCPWNRQTASRLTMGTYSRSWTPNK